MWRWWQLAIRHWRGRLGRTATSVLAIALGVGLVVAVSCCYESLRGSLNEWVVSWLGRSQIHVEHRLGSSTLIDAGLADVIAQDERVATVVGRSRFFMAVEAADGAGDTTDANETLVTIDCYGIDASREYAVRGLTVEGGRLLVAEDDEGIVLQAEVARSIGVAVGEWVRLTGLGGDSRQLKLVGTVAVPKLGMFQQGRGYVPLGWLGRFTGSVGKVHAIDVVVADDASVAAVKGDMVGRLPREMTVSTSDSKLKHVNDGMRLLNLVLLFNSVCALLAAVFVIFSAARSIKSTVTSTWL